MTSGYNHVAAALGQAADPNRARISASFYKTGPGQYGAGDKFIGVTVPQQRAIAKRFAVLPLNDIHRLLHSPVHEERLTGLLILVEQFEKADVARQRQLVKFYLDHTARVNNWDLVDLSAPKILGAWLLHRPAERKILYRLVRSKELWERRIAIVATYAFIRMAHFDDTLKLAEMLISDSHDLIHKAAGWMLREVGKKDDEVLRKFLDLHASRMPRTMLRYAIERLPKSDRRKYLLAS